MVGLRINNEIVIRETRRTFSLRQQNLSYGWTIEPAEGVALSETIRDQMGEFVFYFEPERQVQIYDAYADKNNQEIMDISLLVFSAWSQVWDTPQPPDETTNPDWELRTFLSNNFPVLLEKFYYQITDLTIVPVYGN